MEKQTRVNYVNPNYPDTNGWKTRHSAAIASPRSDEQVAAMLAAWIAYADEHKKRYESEIGEDYILGPEWKRIGLALRALLNGETGRLDCGTLDSIILANLKARGFETEDL